MFITGPDVIKTVTGEDVTMEELGGARTHNTKSGNSHYMASDEEDAIEYTKALLSYLPQNNLDEAVVDSEHAMGPQDLEVNEDDRALDTLVPDSPNQPYDMHTVIESVLDDGQFLEVQALFAPNMVVGFGRVEGLVVLVDLEVRRAHHVLGLGHRLVEVVLRQVGDQRLDVLDGVGLVRGQVVRVAGLGVVGPGTAELLHRDVLAGDGLDDVGAGDEHLRLRSTITTKSVRAGE